MFSVQSLTKITPHRLVFNRLQSPQGSVQYLLSRQLLLGTPARQKLDTRVRRKSSISTTMKAQLPKGAWDSHVHVVDPDAFPLHSDRPYTPKKASLDDLLSFESRLGVDHVCIVSISVYGNDNALLLQSLRRLKGKGRGVVGIDPETITDQELDDMHDAGVRGVRLNLASRNQTLDQDQFASILNSYAKKLKRLQWAIQLYVPLSNIEAIAKEIPKLALPVVIDHLGHPAETDPPRLQKGYESLMALLRNQQVWVKLSGTYRFPNLPETDAYVKEILRVAPDRVVWASDWPHSGGIAGNPNGDRLAVQEYQEVDDIGFVAQCKEWCGHDEKLIQKIFVDNPRKLWQYDL